MATKGNTGETGKDAGPGAAEGKGGQAGGNQQNNVINPGLFTRGMVTGHRG
jgi:hypothetical protein